MSGQSDLVKQVIARRKAALEQSQKSAHKVDRKKLSRPPKKKKEKEVVEEVIKLAPPVEVVNPAKKPPKPTRRTKKPEPVVDTSNDPKVEPIVVQIGGKPAINKLRHVLREILSKDYQKVSIGDDRISLTNPIIETTPEELFKTLSELMEGIITIRSVETIRTGELNPDKLFRAHFTV